MALSVRHLEDETTETGETDRVLDIAIEDDGSGMGATVIEESGVSAYRPPAEGEGLGMQIVRTLVASELRGSIRWQSAEQGGT
ncbi:ATP-binding protein, partial [Mycobacterium tuberculosis]|nr:ATP-binding protein [Mycobacterium tuberculosis]